jgi:glutathione S-transferase
MIEQSLQPVTVYAVNVSYFAGKLEMYFRAKGIPYQFETMSMKMFSETIPQETGVIQMPALKLGDGRWMTDTTPIIAWFEEQTPSPVITPTEPVQRFFSLLLEDYADEWLWRPAMHYRWYDDEGAMQLSRHLVNEMMGEMSGPGIIKRWMIRRRQRGGYTVGDGIREHNRAVVEAIYTRNLAALEAVLQQRPFLLGDSPSLADIGFMGSMFRHFYQDPRPAEIMRQTAPGVAEWVARLWNFQPGPEQGNWLSGIPDDWAFWLDDIGESYLPYLCANAEAFAAGKKRMDCEIGGARYEGAHVSAYRVWCLEQLRAHFEAAPESAQADIRARLEAHKCWEPLWRIKELKSGVNEADTLPFSGGSKMVV